MLIIAIDARTSIIPMTLHEPSDSPNMKVPNRVAAIFSTDESIGAYETCFSLVMLKLYKSMEAQLRSHH